MISLSAPILQFAEQGEKTGWTYIVIPVEFAQKLNPGNKKSFRVKGKLDNHPIAGVALIPMGGGEFILPLNAAMRKATKKRKGDTIKVTCEVDNTPVQIPADFLECMEDEPDALAFFKSIAKSRQNYFIKRIESAKTIETRSKYIAQSVSALSKGWDFGMMVRALKEER